MKSNEVLFDRINKHFILYLKILKWTIWPMFILIAAFALYFGIDLKNTKSELDKMYNSIQLKEKEISILHREIIVENKEFDSKIKVQYDELLFRFDSLNRELELIIDKHKGVIKKANDQIDITSDKYQDLLDESESLEDFSETIKTSVIDANKDLKNFKEEYITEIELAKKGAVEKMDIANNYMNYNLQVFKVFRRLVKLNTDYTILTSKLSTGIVTGEQATQNRTIESHMNNTLDSINILLNDKVFHVIP